MSSAAGMPGAIAVLGCRVKRAAVYQRRRPVRTVGLPSGAAEFGDVAGAAERGWVCFRRRQGAVRVVDCQCRLIEVVQFLLVGPVNPIKNLGKCSL